MTRPGPSRLAAAVLAAALVAGCESGGDISGAATGTATAIATGNPALGAAVGLGTRALVNAGIRFAGRRWQRTEQEAIAAAAGPLAVGEIRPWRAREDLPVGGARGEVRVVRASETPLATCKEVLFSVTEGEGGQVRWYVTSVCREEGVWRWAAAEPAIGRWGSLQ